MYWCFMFKHNNRHVCILPTIMLISEFLFNQTLYLHPSYNYTNSVFRESNWLRNGLKLKLLISDIKMFMVLFTQSNCPPPNNYFRNPLGRTVFILTASSLGTPSGVLQKQSLLADMHTLWTYMWPYAWMKKSKNWYAHRTQ